MSWISGFGRVLMVHQCHSGLAHPRLMLPSTRTARAAASRCGLLSNRTHLKGVIMNKTKILIFSLVVLLLFLASGMAYAAVQASSYSVNWWVFSGGGAPSSAGSFTMNSSLGQSVIGSSSSTNFSIDHGYWLKGAYKTFLPLIKK